MSDDLQLPRAARVFVSFVALLRVNGFAVAPEQTTAFLAAIELLGPRSLEDIRLAGLATLAPPPERRATYDRLFDIHFLGSEAIDHAGAEDEEVVRLQEEGRGEDETLLADEANESGLVAARAEALVERRFAASTTGDALRRLSREAPARLPRRRGHRRMRARRGPCADLRRTLRESVRNDGEVLRLGRLKRRTRPRKILLLIDVSGSMKGRTEDNMKLAHALSHAAAQCRSVHLRHAADARHPRAASQAPRAGAVRRRASGQRLGRRHADRRRAAGVPRRAAVRRLCARRRRRHRLRRAGARRSICRCAMPSQNCRGAPGG